MPDPAPARPRSGSARPVRHNHPDQCPDHCQTVDWHLRPPHLPFDRQRNAPAPAPASPAPPRIAYRSAPAVTRDQNARRHSRRRRKPAGEDRRWPGADISQRSTARIGALRNAAIARDGHHPDRDQCPRSALRSRQWLTRPHPPAPPPSTATAPPAHAASSTCASTARIAACDDQPEIDDAPDRKRISSGLDRGAFDRHRKHRPGRSR